MEKARLDALLVTRGMAASREKAKAMILAGEIYVNGKLIDKPGTTVREEAHIEIIGRSPKYVSRGGFKLEKAIKEFKLDFSGKTVLDVGASTGGYTDCALQNGARKVYALDVGYGQLDWSLRCDPRVVNLEKTNIRYFTVEQLGEKVDIITIDVSFISTSLVFPVVKNLMKEKGTIVTLIKPQFEAGKEKVGKNGVIKDPAVHREVLCAAVHKAYSEGLYTDAVTYSPIKGPRGNIEYFIKLLKIQEKEILYENIITKTVEEAHHQLGG